MSLYHQQGATNLAVDLVGYTIKLSDAGPTVSSTSLGTASAPVDLDATFRPVATFTPTEDGTFNLLVLGGSQGARIFSDVVPAALVHDAIARSGAPDVRHSRTTHIEPERCRAVRECLGEIVAVLGSGTEVVGRRLWLALLQPLEITDAAVATTRRHDSCPLATASLK